MIVFLRSDFSGQFYVRLKPGLLPTWKSLKKHVYSICYISSMTHSNINQSGCQTLCTQDYLLYLLQHVYATEEKQKREKKKRDRCPDVGQQKHVFAFMFWNLHCKVATLVKGISHITLPNLQLLLFSNSSTFYGSSLSPFR